MNNSQIDYKDKNNYDSNDGNCGNDCGYFYVHVWQESPEYSEPHLQAHVL